MEFGGIYCTACSNQQRTISKKWGRHVYCFLFIVDCHLTITITITNQLPYQSLRVCPSKLLIGRPRVVRGVSTKDITFRPKFSYWIQRLVVWPALERGLDGGSGVSETLVL
jgi:hypothetical protein